MSDSKILSSGAHFFRLALRLAAFPPRASSARRRREERKVTRRRPFVGLAICSLITALACTSIGSAIAQGHSVINVSNIEGLYQAVNNPANSEAVVVLASGTYTLTTKDANGQSRSNGGRLVLQSGMALVGQNV